MKKSFEYSASLVLTLLLLALAVPVMAQNVDFESILIKRQLNCILEDGDTVVGGLDGGGLLFWERENPEQVTRMSAGTDLSGNNVTALASSGRFIWVATLGGGMTRIANLHTSAEFRIFASNIGSMDITAVTAEVIGTSERVYYGMDAAGIGLITDSLPGALYSADQDGLIDDNINDLQIFNGDLFAATPSGISRLALNQFTDQNEGLGDLNITELAIDMDGNLVAGGDDGVFLWHPDTETWTNMGWTNVVRGLSGNDDSLWVLGFTSSAYFDGSSWTIVSLPHSRPSTIEAGQDVWVGGRGVDTGMSSSTGMAWYAEYEAEQANFTAQTVDAGLVFNPFGVTFDTQGTTWVGSFTGKAASGHNGDEITNIFEIASADNDSTGLFNHGDRMLTLGSDFDRSLVYVAQYSKGIVRYDLETGDQDLMYGGTCGLEDTPFVNSSIVNLTIHPDGTLIVCYDHAHEQKVRILTDPDNWRGDHGNWHDVPQGSEGIGSGTGVWDALVVRNDVVWFAVEGEGHGLLRWDINGYSAGPDDEITWSDFSDDQWSGPFSAIPGTDNDPTILMTQLALAPDGSIWFGGNGITRFSYDEVFGDVTLEEDYVAKTAAFIEGLITGNVSDLGVDANGDLWVATRQGLNCVRWGTREVEIDAYFDLGNYFSNSLFASLYSANAISALPGGVYNRIAVSQDGQRVALTTDLGAVAWDILPRSAETGGSLESVFCYPNPWVLENDQSRLKLGGLAADAIDGDPAKVKVYNLQGQLVYENNYVSGNIGFWNGTNRIGQPVATGMYVLKVDWRGMTTARTLAVVR